MASIATTGRDKPIQDATVVSYVASAGVAGEAVDWTRLAAEAGLGRPLAEAAVAAVAALPSAPGRFAVTSLKDALAKRHPAVDYGHIRLAAALGAAGALWFSKEVVCGGEAEGRSGAAEAPEPAAEPAADVAPANAANADAAISP